LIPIVFGVLFFKTLNSYFRALHDAVTGTLVREVAVRVLIIVLLIVFFYHLIDFRAFMFGFIASYAVQPVCLLIYLYRRGELRFTFPRLQKSSEFLKEMGVYGGFSLFGGLTTLIVNNIDIIMLGAMLNLKTTAAYAIAFYVGSVIAVPLRSIRKIAVPILAGLIKEKDFSKVRSLYQRTSLDQLIAGALIYIGVWANIHNLMDILPPQYQGTKWIILMIGGAKLFNMAGGVNDGIINNSRYFRFGLYAKIVLVIITVAGNYFLIPIYGMKGAAIATMLAAFIFNVIKLVYVQIKFSMQPFRWNTAAVGVIAAICLVLSFQIPYLGGFFADVIVRSLAITVVFTAAILLFHLSNDVENLAVEAVQRAKRAFNNVL
jgi:O-antigen/teichoic acid export membrane protein